METVFFLFIVWAGGIGGLYRLRSRFHDNKKLSDFFFGVGVLWCAELLVNLKSIYIFGQKGVGEYINGWLEGRFLYILLEAFILYLWFFTPKEHRAFRIILLFIGMLIFSFLYLLVIIINGPLVTTSL